MTRQLHLILDEAKFEFDSNFELQVNSAFLDEKGKSYLQEIYDDLDGTGELIILEKLKFDFKIQRNLILYDDELHFNRYRSITLRSDIYNEFNFSFSEGLKRICRTFEKDCLKVGLQVRIWSGSPMAKHCFGSPNEPGDFGGNGAPGWKLTAYNDAQYDLQTRLHGYKLIRINPYETLMTGGSLKRLDQLLINPKEEQAKAILNWFLRKIQ